MGRVQDRVAVVTGASQALGRAIAERLALEGAAVALGDVDEAGLARTAEGIRASGARVVSVAGDLTEEEPARRLIEAAVEPARASRHPREQCGR